MQLKLIKQETCGECGSAVVAESCKHYHCNGEGFEVREFACGAVLKWSPNFSALKHERECPKSTGAVRKMERRQDAVTQLLSLANDLDVDLDFKEKIIWQLRLFLTR